MKSKFWVFLTMVIIASMLLVSCQPAAAPVEPTVYPTEPVAEEEGRTKVLIFIGFGSGQSPRQQAAHKALQDKYNSTHDTIQIEFMTVQWENHQTAFSGMLALDEAPDLVMSIGVGGIAEFYDEWADLTPYIVKDNYDLSRFSGEATEILQYPEKGTIGLPMCVYPSVVFYNRDLFDAAGVEYPPQEFGANYADGQPWDLNKMVEIARKLSLDADGNDANSPAFDPENMKQWGWDGWDMMTGMEDFAQRFGPENGTGVSVDFRKSLYGTQTYKDAAIFLKDSVWTWHIQANSGQANTLSSDPFSIGMVGMWEMHSWMGDAWPDWNERFRWDVAALPAGPNGKIISITDADTFVIPKSSKHKDEAWEVVKWFYENEQLKELTNIYSCIPADKDLAAGWKADREAAYPDVNMQVFIDALDYIDTPNHETYHPAYAQIHGAAAIAYSKIMSGTNLDINSLMDNLDKEVQALLDEYWKNK